MTIIFRLKITQWKHFNRLEPSGIFSSLIRLSLALHVCVINHAGFHVHVMSQCLRSFVSQCKHILAAYLCQATGMSQQESVSDQQMSVLLSGTAAP